MPNKARHACERRRDGEAAVSCENTVGVFFTSLLVGAGAVRKDLGGNGGEIVGIGDKPFPASKERQHTVCPPYRSGGTKPTLAIAVAWTVG